MTGGRQPGPQGDGTLVTVPTYNERDTLGQLIGALRRHCPRAHVLVVDDASPDGTGVLAEELAAQEGVHVLHRPGKAGLGSAYRDGFGWGLARGYELLAGMDADLSHDPAALPRLLRGLGDADLVVGSRYTAGGEVMGWPLRRLALSRAGNRYVRAVTGLPVRDATSGYRVFRRAVLEAITVGDLESDGYAFQIETALLAHRAGFRIVELPIRFRQRRSGVSKLSRRVVVEAAWRVPKWALTGGRLRVGRHPESAGLRAGGGPAPR